MGRTTPTAAQILRMEYQEWKPFRKPFRQQLSKEDRKQFDDMFFMADLHRTSMMAAIPKHPIRIQLIFMSIVLGHYKQLTKIEEQMEKLL